MALSLASLLCLLVVFLGGLNRNDANLRGLYYFKADTSEFRANITLNPTANAVLSKLNPELTKALISSVTGKKLQDVYYVYMWNYCSGTKGSNNSTETITYCSPRKAQYYFDPIVEWGLNNSATEKYISKEVDGAIKAYATGSKWMFILYAIAFCTTAASVVVGIFAILSRLGSCVTTVVAIAATFFTFCAALLSTILFSTVVGAMATMLKPYNVHMSIGKNMFALDWIAVAFSIGATMFWTVSICCCSGKSSSPAHKRAKHADETNVFGGAAGSGFGSRGYKPLEGHQHSTSYGGGHSEMQYGHGNAGPYHGRDTAYEPYRQV